MARTTDAAWLANKESWLTKLLGSLDEIDDTLKEISRELYGEDKPVLTLVESKS